MILTKSKTDISKKLSIPKGDIKEKEKTESANKTLAYVINNRTTVNKNSKKIDLKTQVSSFSLSSIDFKKAVTKIIKPEEDDEKKVSKPKDAFKFVTLELLWKEYTEKLKKEGKQNIASILSLNNIELKDHHKISYFVESEMNKVEMDREIENLLPFLRNKLNNYSIEIELKVKKTTRESLIYSGPDKYKHLKKINPVIEELRDIFDLDF